MERPLEFQEELRADRDVRALAVRALAAREPLQGDLVRAAPRALPLGDEVAEERGERDVDDRLRPGKSFNFTSTMTLYESMRANFVSRSRELVQR